jgi:hypothetical protein
LDTDSLIEALSDQAAPVRRLPPPWLRTLAWLVPGFVVMAIVVVAVKGVFDPRMVLADPRMVVEEAATLATAITAALCAFQSTVPGAGRRWFWVPAATLAVWLASVGAGCVGDYVRLGAEGLALRFDGGCMLPAVLIGIVPSVAIVAMLQRGAPLVPRLTLAFAGLAVAALANFGLVLFHAGDVSIMVITWHFGFVVALSALAGWLGPIVLGWRHQAIPGKV